MPDIVKWIVGGLCFAYGGYCFLCLPVPKLRPRRWENESALIFVLSGLASVALGMAINEIVRPCSTIATIAFLCVGFYLRRRKPTDPTS
jgi:hypothetical protein